MMSRNAAPSSDVTIPILRGATEAAAAPLAKSPSAWSFFFSCSKAIAAPRGRAVLGARRQSVFPLRSYTPRRPRAMTCRPSSGLNFRYRTADRNITALICAPPSFSVKYTWPVFQARQFEISPSPYLGEARVEHGANRGRQLDLKTRGVQAAGAPAPRAASSSKGSENISAMRLPSWCWVYRPASRSPSQKSSTARWPWLFHSRGRQ